MNYSQVSDVVPLSNDKYYWFLLDSIRTARVRIWAAIFIADVRPLTDPLMYIREVVRALAVADWRGVNARVLVGTSNLASDIVIANSVFAALAHAFAVPVRVFRSDAESSLHSKYVVLDSDWSICGSHNWTFAAAFRSAEDSVALRSAEMNQRLAVGFLQHWEAAEAI